MIFEIPLTFYTINDDGAWCLERSNRKDRRSDFKDGEEPRYTGFKRNYRKAKYSKHDYWREHIEIRPRCWKNQRKTKHQYHRIPTIDLYEPFERDECGIVITDEMIDEMIYLAETYGPAVLGL